MGWKQFISELIGHLSWPIVSVVFLVVFRNELVKIIQRLAKFKYKDIEIDFEKVKQQAEEVYLEVATSDEVPKSPEILSLEDQIIESAESSPPASILLAWSGLESSIASTVSRLAISPESPLNRSPFHNIEMLKKYADLPKTHFDLLNEMRMLRNKVAHPSDGFPNISQEEARNYSDIAIALMQYFNSMKRNG